jgi:uroporphyrinogen-III decarboxylase
LLGPRTYRDAALPYEKRVIAELKSRLAQPVSLHICGNALPILADMASSGADVLELDHQVDIAAACGALGPEIAIWGNLDPVGLLAQGTPGEIRRATNELLRSAQACGHGRLVVSSGCTLAPGTPAENIEALLQSARCFPRIYDGLHGKIAPP